MKKIFALLAAFLFAVPAFAVFDEDDLSTTLTVLRSELKLEMDRLPAQEGDLDGR